MHFSKKLVVCSSVGPKILAFGSHCSANVPPILDCFTPNFKLTYEDSDNIKADCVSTVVFNLHQIKSRAFLGYLVYVGPAQPMKNPGNFKVHLVLRPGVFQVRRQRIFNNSFLMMDKMDSYVIRQAFSLQPYSFILFYSFKSTVCYVACSAFCLIYFLLSSCIKNTV